jgi:LysM domain
MSSRGTDRREAGTGHRFQAADAAMAAVILLLGLSLAVSGGSLAQRWRSSSTRLQVPSFEDQLGIVANTAGLILITWWAMSLAIALASALLDRSGRTGAAAVTAKFSPAFMRRLVVAAIGWQLVAAPMAAADTLPRPEPSPRPAVSAGWAPTTAVIEGVVLPRPLRVLATPDVTPPWTPRGPAVEPGALAARQLRMQQSPREGAEVTVRAGDSLWSLAAARLGPLASDVDIAREWPRLYQANREVIGESPHLLHPGQILRFPAGG